VRNPRCLNVVQKSVAGPNTRAIRLLYAAVICGVAVQSCWLHAQQANGRHVIWKDPGVVASLDLVGGPGGRERTPRPPFVFSEAESSGTAPKLLLQDANRALWSVKFGKEAKPETFAIRLVWAVGYFVDAAYFIPGGTIDSVGYIGSAAESFLDRADGNGFRAARFELRDPNLRFQGKSWSFVNNPFVGTPELKGLKIMMMLVSNWDVKDARSSDPNTAILIAESDTGQPEFRYLVTDWGATMGKWGNIVSRTRWNCEAYAEQTKKFVIGQKDGLVGFGFSGKHTTDMTHGITVADVRWLMQSLGQITDHQIRDALQASGATPHEVDCFGRSVRSRIEQLRAISQSPRT
jgi:hypothetical protein